MPATPGKVVLLARPTRTERTASNFGELQDLRHLAIAQAPANKISTS
jgi:hypothetical protein